MSKKMLFRRMIASSTLPVVVLGAAMGYVYGNPGTLDPTPVVYKTSSAPDVTPQEAERAVSSAKDLSIAFRVASDKVLPSVVTIETKTKAVAVKREAGRRGRGNSQQVNPFSGTPFEDMFRGFNMEEFEGGDGGGSFQFRGPRGMPSEGLGSGVVIDPSGLIMTNNHVVAGGENVDVLVRLWDGREFKADKVWTDPKTDIAIVKIKAMIWWRPRSATAIRYPSATGCWPWVNPSASKAPSPRVLLARPIAAWVSTLARVSCKPMRPSILAIAVDHW